MIWWKFFILFLCLVLTIATRVEHVSLPDPLLSELTPEENEIHQCLQKNNHSRELQMSCLKGTSFDQYTQRAPSSESHSLIEKLEWFFSSARNRFSFYRIIDGLKRARESLARAGKLLDGHGIGLLGEAYIGVGESWMGEVVRHDGKLALFCAPGISGRTDAGVGLGVTALRTLSCASNNHYAGNFLTIGAGVSGELIGLPIGLGLNYSFGADIKKLRSELQLARRNERYHPRELKGELRRLSSMRELFRERSKETEMASGLILYGATLASIADSSLQFAKTSGSKYSVIKKALFNRDSLGNQFRKFALSGKFQEFFQENDMPNLKEFFLILANSLSGCDSLGGAGSLSLSLSPVAVSVSYTHYSLLYETADKELNKVQKISPLALLNPFLLDANELKFIMKNAKMVLGVPKKISNNCRIREVLR